MIISVSTNNLWLISENLTKLERIFCLSGFSFTNIHDSHDDGRKAILVPA